ncbi:Urea carboxylase-related aminomethyltransferase [Klebsiella michiganensis]|nr:Urea carboxylase-related aminomethyltransferase [Klebsiella michiganensis]
MTLIASNRRPEDAVYRHVIPAGEPWLFEIQKGQTLRLLDLEGNQAIDTLFYNADNPRERYDPQRTLRRQGNAYLTTGSVLYSNLGNPLLTSLPTPAVATIPSAAPVPRRATPCATPG